MNWEIGFWLAVAVVFVALRIVGKLIDNRLHRLQREALDWSVRWSYVKGYADGCRRADPDLGMEVVVTEFRDTFGPDRREVRK